MLAEVYPRIFTEEKKFSSIPICMNRLSFACRSFSYHFLCHCYYCLQRLFTLTNKVMQRHRDELHRDRHRDKNWCGLMMWKHLELSYSVRVSHLFSHFCHLELLGVLHFSCMLWKVLDVCGWGKICLMGPSWRFMSAFVTWRWPHRPLQPSRMHQA